METPLKRNAKLHSSLNYVEVPTALLLPFYLAFFCHLFGKKKKFIWRFSETIPLILFNNSIDFVQRFH